MTHLNIVKTNTRRATNRTEELLWNNNTLTKRKHKTTRDVKMFLKFCRYMYIARSASPPQT